MKLEKITNCGPGPRRRYNDACGAAHGLELVGDRWALLVVRELMLGPKRFCDLKADLPGISANVLTQRLEELEAVGILTRCKLPPPASVQVYELTPWGYEAEPILQVLGRWAARSPYHDPTLPLTETSFLLSLRTMLDPARAEGLRLTVGFRFGAQAYTGCLGDGQLAIRRGEAENPDIAFEGAVPALVAAVYGGQPLSELEASGALTVTGDRALAARFVTLFPLPPKVGEEG
ncbi:winged helix-turn-helix transcriptional regulator [Pedomonas sp. V897]|uniref:winged helix-turn-helix transcriptional regulator n=1 Tax=Pedomonas sp. V897 TaxID=3446482 RepID=UPI003EE3169E